MEPRSAYATGLAWSLSQPAPSIPQTKRETTSARPTLFVNSKAGQLFRAEARRLLVTEPPGSLPGAPRSPVSVWGRPPWHWPWHGQGWSFLLTGSQYKPWPNINQRRPAARLTSLEVHRRKANPLQRRPWLPSSSPVKGR